MPRCTVTRRLHFNAAHRLHNPRWDDAENARVFGACSNPNYHGHNYVLDVSVAGEIAADTGYVLDIARIRDIATECLIRHLDHKNLNLDVPWFRGGELNPSAENIAVVAWRVLAPALRPATLVRVRLWETERNYVDYTGE
jgi:6-pyruvoyltetrahydropterin/6-carboxytetrahydropterin synthase